MYSKRKTGAVYGKRRFTKPSVQLWDECMAASPVRLKTFASPVAPVLIDNSFGNSVEASDESSSVSYGSSPRKLLTEQSTNISRSPAPAKKKLVAAKKTPRSATAMPFHDPLVTSTPAQSSSTHIRFDSDSDSDFESDRKSSSSSLSDPSSDLGGLTDALALTTISTPQAEHARLFQLCDQYAPLAFDEYIRTLVETATITKLGEASYSEVFLAHSDEQQVLKVIPFGDEAGEVPINDIIQELRITHTMSDCRGFVQLKRATIVQGKYPEPLLNVWDKWHEEHVSESDRPDWYLSSQRYCIIALENGGTDIEHAVFSSWQASLCCFEQVVQAIAIGEAKHGFEHRDMHWGNVLVRESDCLDTAADNVTIIDYTLSRAVCQDGVAFYGFGDRAIFEADGNDYQFEVYRLMLELVEQDEEGEHWDRPMPRTNVLWLHYLADKLLTAKGLKRPPAKKPHSSERLAWQKLEQLREVMNPRRRYRGSDLPVNGAQDVLALL
jgi:serine/threonine-protein kinase haspin